MADDATQRVILEYVRRNIRLSPPVKPSDLRPQTTARLVRVLSLLPVEVAEPLLSGARKLTFMILPDTAIPFGMRTLTEGSPEERRYTISMYNEHQDLPEDLFVGSVLRELGHVVAQRPPESEWPEAKGERARFRERLECLADAMVWKWGLRDYSIRYLHATYPRHRADEIIEAIRNLLDDEVGADPGV